MLFLTKAPIAPAFWQFLTFTTKSQSPLTTRPIFPVRFAVISVHPSKGSDNATSPDTPKEFFKSAPNKEGEPKIILLKKNNKK